MSAHLDQERLTHLVYGLMEPAEKRDAVAHASACPDCAKSMRHVERERELIVEATETPAPPPRLVRKIETLVQQGSAASRISGRKLAWAIACAAGALAAIGLTLALSGGRHYEDPPGVSKVKKSPPNLTVVKDGKVSVKRGGAWAEERAGYAAARGDRLRIDDAAGAILRLHEGSMFKFRPGSEFEVQGIRGPDAVLRVFEGEVHCNVVAAPEPCSIDVGSSKVTVVGTEFVVQVLEEQAFEPDKRLPRPPRVSLRVISGAVDFRAGASDLRVTSGLIALAGADGPPWIWGTEKEVQQAINSAFEETIKKGLEIKVVLDREEPWRVRKDEEIEALVGSIPWKKLAEALVWYEKERDDAVMEQREARTVPPDLKVDLELGWGRIRRLAAELRTAGDFMGACRNDLAAVRFVESMTEALAGTTLSENQRQRLNAPALVVNLLPLMDASAPPLPKWKARGERLLAFVKQLKEVLTANQYHHLVHSVGPAFFSEDYRVWVVEAETAEEATERVARIWMENFKLPPFVQAPLGWIAGEFVRAHLEASRQYRRQQGESLTRLQELELSLRHLDHQILAEGRVSQIPSLTEATKGRALAGSKALFKIRVPEGK